MARHKKRVKVRKISNALSVKWTISPNVYVCESCRKRLLCESPPEENIVKSQCSQASSDYSQPNQDESFVPEDKYQHIATQTDMLTDNEEILNQLKDKFNNPSTSISVKTMILTIAPKSWSENKLSQEFGTSRRQARKAKQLVEQLGILSSPNPRDGRKLSAETESLVKSYYLREDISRVMPGKKDFVSIKLDDGKRTHVQKQLLMCNIDELYQKFKIEHPNVKVGLTKFFTFRPRQCVLAGDAGTHMVCVCMYHENVKLMLRGGDVANLTSGTTMHLSSYKECLKMMMCANPTPECHLMTTKTVKSPNESCSSCPGLSGIRDHLKTVFDDNDVTNIQFKKWEGTDRFTIATHVSSADDFVDCLCIALDLLKPHAYIAEQQALYFKSLKETISEGEILVQCDFAENYSFVIQDAAQSFHWNNDQATLLTSVFYYKEGNEIKHGSIVMISDDLKHDTPTFYAFQKILHQHLADHGIAVSILKYITDGAPQHFKNRFNFVNLFYYRQDFNLSAELHFHATSHGKGPCDGLGGNLKRLATRSSLQSTNNAITTPLRLYEWAKSSLTETSVYYCSKESIQEERDYLKVRFASAVTIPGTKKLHAFFPTTEGLLVKRTSQSATGKIVHITK